MTHNLCLQMKAGWSATFKALKSGHCMIEWSCLHILHEGNLHGAWWVAALPSKIFWLTAPSVGGFAHCFSALWLFLPENNLDYWARAAWLVTADLSLSARARVPTNGSDISSAASSMNSTISLNFRYEPESCLDLNSTFCNLYWTKFGRR